MGKLITVSENLPEDILPHLKDTPYEKKIKDLIENTGKYQPQNITYVFPEEKGKVLSEANDSYFPREAKVERIVDGDTIVLHNGSIVRYVGITCPEENEPFDKESTEANRKLVEGKEIKLEYDNYRRGLFC